MTVYKVPVDYDLTIEEAAKAGKYDFVNSNITSQNFPVVGSGKRDVEIRLLPFDDVCNELVANLAGTYELLALGARYPQLQRCYLIAAMGTPWRDPSGKLQVPTLYGPGSGRFLSLEPLEREWDSRWRFAVVQK